MPLPHAAPGGLLGFYVNTGDAQRLRFVPLAWDPELAGIICRGSFDLGEEARSVRDCRNGRVLVFVGRCTLNGAMTTSQSSRSRPKP
jgi:hypothetical protein